MRVEPKEELGGLGRGGGRDHTMLRIQHHWQNGAIHSFAHFLELFRNLHHCYNLYRVLVIYICKLGADTNKHLPCTQVGLQPLVNIIDYVDNKNFFDKKM